MMNHTCDMPVSCPHDALFMSSEECVLFAIESRAWDAPFQNKTAGRQEKKREYTEIKTQTETEIETETETETE